MGAGSLRGKGRSHRNSSRICSFQRRSGPGGIDLSDQQLSEILTVDKETWKEELKGIKEWYAKFDHMPDELIASLAKLELDLDK